MDALLAQDAATLDPANASHIVFLALIQAADDRGRGAAEAGAAATSTAAAEADADRKRKAEQDPSATLGAAAAEIATWLADAGVEATEAQREAIEVRLKKARSHPYTR